jgi:hypothetical protein
LFPGVARDMSDSFVDCLITKTFRTPTGKAKDNENSGDRDVIFCRHTVSLPTGYAWRGGDEIKNPLKSERTVTHKREKKKTRRIKRVAKDI